MRFSLPIICLLFTVGLSAHSVSAGIEPVRTDAVRIEAETLSHEQDHNTYKASGKVSIRSRGYTLLADTAVLEGDADVAMAAGNVVLSREGGEMRGDAAVLDLATNRGKVHRASLFIEEGNFHIAGATIEKTGDTDYRAKRASFTTCDGSSPSWKFSASEVDVQLEEYAAGKDALFYVHDVPVFWLPYVVFPVKRERQSGFLMPRLGSSSRRGFYFDAAWYQVFSPSQDLTVNLDMQTRRGVGLGLDYRYIRSLKSSGEVRGYLIFDTSADKWRGNFIQNHQEIFAPDAYLKSSVNIISDRRFYREYAEDSAEYTRNALESTVFFTKNWQYYSLTPQVRWSQILDPDVKEPTYQKLPVITLTGINHRVAGTPLFFSLSSDATNFLSEDGNDGFRARIKPQLSAVYHPLPFLDAYVRGGYEARTYALYGDASTSRVEGTPSAGAGISTTAYRQFDLPLGKITRLSHIMTPALDYAFSEGEDDRAIPDFDYYDHPVRENRIIYSLTNYIRGAWTDEDGTQRHRDLLYLRVSQSSAINGSRRDLLTPVDRTGNLSDLRVETRIYPLEQLRILSDVRINTEHGRFSTANVGIDYTDTSGNRAGFGYRHTPGFVDFVEGKLTLALFQPFVLDYRGRYSIDRHEMLESLYSVEYRHQCWSVTFTYRNNKNDNDFLVTFNLAGIGSLGKVRAF